MNMIEKVAKAIEIQMCSKSWRDYEIVAKAAIQAMREPTAEMIKEVSDYGSGLDNYQSMIDAALELEK